MTLYNKYRPMSFDQIMGNEQVVVALKSKIFNQELPQALLFCGPTGCGKTTLARLVALHLNCKEVQKTLKETSETSSKDRCEEIRPCLKCEGCVAIIAGSSPDYLEINAANTRGIDDVRNIVSKLEYVPNHLDNRILIWDESHQITGDGQNCLLKPLEDPYPNTYIILCTTAPEKLLKTVRGRCEKLEVRPLEPWQKKQLVSQTVEREEKKLEKDALELFSEHCSSNPRNLLNELSLLLSQENPNASDVIMSVLDLETSKDEAQAIDFARAMSVKTPSYKKLKDLCQSTDKSTNFEGMRRVILSYGKTCLVKNGGADPKFMNMIKIFLKPLEESNPEADFVFRVHYYLSISGS
jgi:DNA polymerase III subunit gamma/tau